jgi:Flp pilus assembly protein TadD
MNQRSFGFGLLFLTVLVWSGCDSGQNVPEPTTEPTGETTPAPMTETTPASTTEPPSMAGTAEAEGALMATAGTAGAEENNEGVDHYQQGHWDVAQEHFTKAVAANAELAEAHYNLALALDKQEKHPEATTHFKKALELAPANPLIAGSKILQAHVGG